MEQQKENKMGVMPIPKLLVTMSLPIVISMLVQALYNIVDSIFVAKLGENAFAALTLSFPIQMLMISVGVGTGVGINALLSRNLGQKNQEQANKTAINGIFLCFLSFLVFAIFGLFFSRTFFKGQIKTQEIIDYGTQYLTICTVFSIGIFMQIATERLLQATGNAFYSMITQGLGAIINIILDPILIFGLFGMPKMGVAGAAIATIVGQIMAAALGIYFNIKKNPEIHVSFHKFRPDGRTIKQIYAVGVPAIVMQSIGSVMTLGMNKILLMFSPAAVNVFGAYFKLQSFIFMPVFGFNNGMIPILAYNYGARNKKRIVETIKMSLMVAVIIMIVGMLIFQIFPEQLLGFFKPTQETLTIGVPALRIISISFLFAGMSIILLSVFQAFGSGVLSLIVSATRQLIIILPVAYVFAKLYGIHMVWWSFPVAEVASVILSFLFLRVTYRKKIKDIE